MKALQHLDVRLLIYVTVFDYIFSYSVIVMAM